MCLTGPYWALLSLYRPYFAFVHGRTHERTLRLIGLLSQPKISSISVSARNDTIDANVNGYTSIADAIKAAPVNHDIIENITSVVSPITGKL